MINKRAMDWQIKLKLLKGLYGNNEIVSAQGTDTDRITDTTESHTVGKVEEIAISEDS